MDKISSAKDRCKAALTAMTTAIHEAVATNPDGLRNDEVARLLGLQTSVNGGQRNHLTFALLNRLVDEGKLEREKRGSRIYYVSR